MTEHILNPFFDEILLKRKH